MKDLKKHIEHIIKKRNLNLFVDEVMPFIKPTIGLLKERVETVEDIALGASKMGDCPDLPKGWQFPYYEHTNTPLTFICQINCEEASAFDISKELPPKGILYFFMETLELPSYSELKEDVRGSWKVMYYDGDMNLLERTDFPLFEDNDDYQPFPLFKLNFKNIITMLDPYENCDVYSKLESLYDEDVMDDLVELARILRKELHNDLEELFESETAPRNTSKPYHQLLGYHKNNQADALLDIIVDFFKIPEEDAYETEREKGDWSLLFQFDYDEELDWYLDGTIHFFIRKADLDNCDFSDTYVTWSC